jgi:LmbE family N-acetylglucosaminyl deacetylase
VAGTARKQGDASLCAVSIGSAMLPADATVSLPAVLRADATVSLATILVLLAGCGASRSPSSSPLQPARTPPASLARSVSSSPRRTPPDCLADSGAERWVLAPHPDDESLFGAEPLTEALAAGRSVRVIWMTNGDLGCERDGWLRQREAVAAMEVLGVAEDRLVFLGYPDGWLDALGTVPLAPLERRLEDGTCGRGNTTYGRRGACGVDVHRARTGMPGEYTAANAIEDLVWLLEHDRPSDVFTSHPMDDHPDHAATYVLLRRALERTTLASPPRIHRALVHVGGCWPNGSSPAEPCPEASTTLGTPYPPLPEPLARYLPNERLAVEDGGLRARRAIAAHRSQLHTDVEHDWLGTFARSEAIYWREDLRADPLVPGRWTRTPAEGLPAGEVLPCGEPKTEPDPEHPEGNRVVIPIAQRAPLRIAFDARVPEHAEALVHVLAREADPSAGYQLAVIDGTAVEVRRPRDRVLRRFRVPDDGARSQTHRWEMRIDPRPDDGGAVEIEVRRDGELLGISVDARPFVTGDHIDARTRGSAYVGEIRAVAEPGAPARGDAVH